MNRKDKVKNVKKSIIEVNSPQGHMLPSTVDVKEFSRARINEINLMSKELNQAKYSSARRVFQQLPRHMRRRAASYNIKRLPTRLRMRAMEEIKNDAPKGKYSKNMKNCRRWRRRPSSMSPEFKSKKGWLETHIWHSKRCKMIDFWGFKIAAHLNEKCFKSTFRSSQKGVLLHDFSYYHMFSVKSINMVLFEKDFCIKNVVDIVLQSDCIQMFPIKFIFNAFDEPVIYIHPAAKQSGMLEHDSFVSFIQKYAVVLSSTVEEDKCTFMLMGPMSEIVLKTLLKTESNLEFPIKTSIQDPRIHSHQFSTDISCVSEPIKESVINSMKSEMVLTDACHEASCSFPIFISNYEHSYLLACPKKWARILWYSIVKIKSVKVAGIKQIEMISFENEQPVFPRDYVHSPAFEIWCELERQKLESIYYAKPSSKRPSFQKFGVVSPFKSNFKLLGRLKLTVLVVDGKGVIEERAEIYSPDKVLIGYATSTSPSSLKSGASMAIASISESFNQDTVLVRNISSPVVFRQAKVQYIR